MTVKEELINEKNKLKEMSFDKKIKYIWEYYRFHILGIVAAIIIITSFVNTFRANSKPVFLNMAIINSDIAYDDDNYIQDDFISFANIDINEYNLTIDPGFIISGDDADQMTYANTQKLVVMYAAATLDVILGPDSFIDQYGVMGSHMDLSTILSKEYLNKLQDEGYELYYTAIEEESDDENAPPVKGEPYIAGVYLDNSDYLNKLGNSGAYTTQKAAGHRPVFTIAISCQNTENAVRMLEMLTGVER